MKNITAATLATLIATNGFASPAVTSSNKLGMKLGLETAKVLKNENYMVSPISLQQALTLAANGTARGTRAQVEAILGGSLEELNVSSKTLVEKISFSAEQRKRLQKTNSWLNPSVLSISNSIWSTNGATDGRIFEYSDTFKSIAKSFYGSAEPMALDFMKPEASMAINKWAEEKTNGLVKKIISAEALNPMLWVVMNAAYVEASWQVPFTELTQDAPKFQLANQSLVDAKMITGKPFIAHLRHRDGGQVASIPFSKARGAPELEFIVYLPSKSMSLSDAQTVFFSERFLSQNLEGLERDASHKEVRVVLPKFSFDTSVEMKEESELTRAMGLTFLFEDFADFSLMATSASAESKVGLIKQNSRIELDEKGVKAAAVTLIGGIERTSVPVEPSEQMIVDRPFMFAIVEKATKAVLFTGSVVDPR